MAQAAIAPKPKKRGRTLSITTPECLRDRQIVRALAAWFVKKARPLPWRTMPRRAYPSLVSELMLQQTQVSRVLEKFGPFLKKFPSVEALAAADESDVLAAWSGLGYYRRARLLQACSRAIVQTHGGVVPCGIDELVELPGIGRYTAGAIASIVFGEPTPIVDGNVCRVLQRLEGMRGHAGEKKVTGWAWERAGELVALTTRGKQAAAFNEGLMELGATVCVPDSPRCGQCPLRHHCSSNARNLTSAIPEPKPRTTRAITHHSVAIVRRTSANGATEYLLEQRPATGLWAGLWQPPTLERETALENSVSRLLKRLRIGVETGGVERAHRDSVFHTTHREVRFRAWTVAASAVKSKSDRRWVASDKLDTLAISNAHRRLLAET